MIASILNAFILVWGVASGFAAAFQCSIPDTWDFAAIGAECFDIVGSLVLCVDVKISSNLYKTSFWTCFAIINIISDVALILWPIYLFSGLQTGLGRKALVIACFGSRILSVCTLSPCETPELIILKHGSSNCCPNYLHQTS